MLLYPAKGDPAGPIATGAKPIGRRRGHRFPLIVFSHGYSANGPAYASVLANFVRRGYVVAAPTFPLSRSRPRRAEGRRLPESAGGRQLRADQGAAPRPGPPGLRRAVDRHDIGVAGHSLGAITTLGVADNSCCLDPRIDAASEWSGAFSPSPAAAFSRSTRPPSCSCTGRMTRPCRTAEARRPTPVGCAEGVPHPGSVLPRLLLRPMAPAVRQHLDGFLRRLPQGQAAGAAQDGDRRQRPGRRLAAAGPRSLEPIRGLLRSRPIALQITGSLAIGLPRPGAASGAPGRLPC